MTENNIEYDGSEALPESFVDQYKEANHLLYFKNTDEDRIKGASLRNELIEKLEKRINHISNAIVKEQDYIGSHYTFECLGDKFFMSFYDNLNFPSDPRTNNVFEFPLSWLYNKNFHNELLSLLAITKDKAHQMATDSVFTDDDEYKLIESLILLSAKAKKFSIMIQDMLPESISRFESNGFVVERLPENQWDKYLISW